MKRSLIFPAFLLSGFLSGWLICPSDTHSFAVFYIAGLLFGITFAAVNGFAGKKILHSLAFISISTLAYFAATMLCMQGHVHMLLVGLAGAAIVSLGGLLLFKIHPVFVLLAIGAGGALGPLMYITDMDHGNELAYTFSAWQGVVGTLLSAGLYKNYGNDKGEQV
jgi:hypothetical protein